ncbi:MAG: hypothetical protein M1830_007219 [Pleopsidium flavum]|nr:MAG: hypothetical protein M1830_007219 [Pleopsidium flavum]
MAALFNGLFGGPKSAQTPISSADDADFADFAGAPDPSPASIPPGAASPAIAQVANPTSGSFAVPYTRWYRIWERASPSDFYQELFILPFVLLVVFVHVWGTRKNKRKAKGWITAHAPVLEREFAVVGFGGRKAPSLDDVQSSGLTKALGSDELVIPEELLKEKTAQEYSTYATGRQNVAFVDIKLSLFKRYNPIYLMGEYVVSFFFDSIPTPVERMEATLYAFDGKEKDLVPVPGGKQGQEIIETRSKGTNSSYDGFVWAVVNKEVMRRLRDDRYDVSLTSTKDHAKLPSWATVMTESAEVSELLVTPELIKVVEEAGDALEYLIVTDQPLDKPNKLNETIPKKRISLSLKLSSSPTTYSTTLPLFTHFLRLPDTLVQSAHFRPEVTRRLKATREEEIRKLKRVDEDEKAEERKVEGDKKKRELRDSRLKGMSAEEQRKFLDKEREKESRKSSKKMTKKA